VEKEGARSEDPKVDWESDCLVLLVQSSLLIFILMLSTKQMPRIQLRT
jgi:hypothetical protein